MAEFRLNRFFSKPITSTLLHLPVTPNHVTLASLFFGVSAGILFSQGTYGYSLLAAFCYQLAVVLDNCDGEIARAKNLGSPFGAALDILTDFLTDFSLFAGLWAGMIRQSAGGPVRLFGILCLSGSLLHFFLVLLEKYRGFGPAAFGTPHPEYDKRSHFFLTLFDALREGDSSWFVVLFSLAGQSAWLFWLGGFYMQILWLAAFCVNFRWLFKTVSHENS